MMHIFLIDHPAAITIGFLSTTNTTVSESDGQVNIIIGVILGSLQTDVVAYVSVSDLTTTGMRHLLIKVLLLVNYIAMFL